MNRVAESLAHPDKTADRLSRLASEVKVSTAHLTAEEIDSLIAALPGLSGDLEKTSYAWRIVLRQPIIDTRLLDVATATVSSYRALPHSSGYEKGVDLQLMYLLSHGSPAVELIDRLAAMPIGRIKEVIAEHLLAIKEFDRGFLLLIDAIPFAEHATLNGIGFWMAELATPERRAQVQRWLSDARQRGDRREIEALEFAYEQMG
jgi:hypothetical protein